MRIDLLKSLGVEKDVTNCIVLTHNIDFVFLQSVVLSELRKCGRPSLTVFADIHCAADTFSHQCPVLNSLGVRYRVVPVLMKPGFRFHPKAVLLSGLERGVLFVGSGNLTFGGWRENAEVWVRFESSVDGGAPFAAFSRYLRQILASVPLQEVIEAEIAEAFDTKTRAWAADVEGQAGLIGRVNSGGRLVDRIGAGIGSAPVDLLTICSPYFDEAGAAARELINRIRPRRTEVILQEAHSGLTKRAAASLGENIRLMPVLFRKDEPPVSDRERFIHAKFYACHQRDRVIVYAGSANCSRAALTSRGGSGNAELLAIQSMSADEFQEQYLGEMEVSDREVELSQETSDLEDTPLPVRSIYVLGASFESGTLHVAYTISPGITLTRCLVDDLPYPYQPGAGGILTIKLDRQPRTVALQGTLAGKVVLSNQSWIDNEQELRSTARTRWLGDSISKNVQSARWGIGAWVELLRVFYKYTQYIPVRSSSGVRRGHNNAAGAVATYSEADVFSQGYGLPRLGLIDPTIAGEDRIQSLRKLLLRWFGMPFQEETIDEFETANEESVPSEFSTGDNDEAEAVDRPERIPPDQTPPPRFIEPTEADRRQARHIVEQLLKVMTARDYLENRQPELLATDLKLASVLFRVGLCQGWISPSEYCETAYRIWSGLFLNSDVSKSGWLEHRYLTAECRSEFEGRMISAELSAALAAWALTVYPPEADPQYARFIVACALAIAHLPWLWLGADARDIAIELTAVLTHTSDASSADKPSWAEIEARWRAFARRGRALQSLESASSHYPPVQLRTLISQQRISVGELLWQGEAGFCVATEACDRSVENNVKVLRLQGMADSGTFRTTYLLPVRGLLGVLASDLCQAELAEIEGLNDEFEAQYSEKLPSRVDF